MSVTATWALTETVGGAIAVTKDALRIATRDNIQPVALLASERFGATVAMCQNTRKKIELSLQQTSEITFVTFLKAQVGFASDTSIDMLSKSLAGVNFLALTTALISSTDIFEVATALEKMIEASASDKTILPTAYQLKALVEKIEPRLACVGFTNEILGWSNWWKQTVGPDVTREACLCPEGMQLIVDAFRSLARVGDTQFITIYGTSCGPWLTAFTKWCLGIPPQIQAADGEILLDSPTSRVILQCSHEDLGRKVKVELSNIANKLLNVFETKTWERHNSGWVGVCGMISASMHGQQLLRKAGLEGGLGNRALLQALPPALKLVKSAIVHTSEIGEVDHAIAAVLFGGSDNPGPLPSLIGCAFPCDRKIAETMATYLSLEEAVDLKTLSQGILITDLPVVRMWLEELKKECPRHTYKSEFISCSCKVDFLSVLSKIIANILCLSLLNESIESIFLYYETVQARYLGSMELGLQEAARCIISERGKLFSIPVESILYHTLDLLGHDVVYYLSRRDWVMSSCHGQTVYPKVFESNIIRKTGILELFCIPGELSLKGKEQCFQLVRGRPELPFRRMENLDTSFPPTRSLNLYSDVDLHWLVSTQDEHISANLSWTKTECRTNPFGVLCGLCAAIFADSCSHSADHLIDNVPMECYFDSLLNVSKNRDEEKKDKVRIVPTRGNDGLRILAIAFDANLWEGAGPRFTPKNPRSRLVIVNKACLGCALKICHLAGSNTIIC